MSARGPSELSLQVVTSSCSCGNQWTESYLVLSGNGCFGGTPSAHEARAFPLTSIYQLARAHAHCFACAAPTLPTRYERKRAPLEGSSIGDPKGSSVEPHTRPERRRKRQPLTLDALDEGIF